MAQSQGLSDSSISGLNQRVVPSDIHPNVHYRLLHQLGEGGMGVAFYALRQSPDGVAPAVLKVVRPQIVATAGPTAALMIRKEAIALGRLNERVPPTPFVVRFLDTGNLRVQNKVDLPWIAIEYVHGGPEGTTLEQRVEFSVKKTGYAFDCQRAAHALECITSGLEAIHEAGVVHRDLTPGNVLCCGFGNSEIFKIADFGIARPSGVNVTFGNVALGTPGYSAPEQTFASEPDVGTWTDVFSLACLCYFLLTGQPYFTDDSPTGAFMLIRNEKRRSILECRSLCPELRSNESACRIIDTALALASAAQPAQRTRTAQLFAASVLPALRATAPRSQRANDRLIKSLMDRQQGVEKLDGWTWTMRHPPGDSRLVRSVAWDGDGHCLAVTTDGLEYWNGTGWAAASTLGVENPAMLRFASLIRPGQWLLAAGTGSIALYGSEGAHDTMRCPDAVSVSHASGDPDDLAVIVGERAGARPLLYTVAARHFFRPVTLEAAAIITGLARIDEGRWILAGRTVHGTAFAALYNPLSFEVSLLYTPSTGALITCAGQVDRGIGIAAGRSGVTVTFDGSRTMTTVVPGEPDIASCAVDVRGRSWIGTAGALWTRDNPGDARWICAWRDPSQKLPLVALRTDVGVVTAVTVDGAVIEGRASFSQ